MVVFTLSKAPEDAFCTVSGLFFEWPVTADSQRSGDNHQQHHIHQHACQSPGNEQ